MTEQPEKIEEIEETENNAAEAAEEGDGKEEEIVKLEYPEGTKLVGKKLVLKKFVESKKGTGKFTGFAFWSLQFTDLNEAITHYSTLSTKSGKKGDEIILGILNSALSFRFRNQATQDLTEKSKKKNPVEMMELFKTNPIVITEQEALDYIPGEREVDSISGLERQMKELLKMAKSFKDFAAKAAKEGNKEAEQTNLELARNKIKDYTEKRREYDAKRAKELEEIMELLPTEA